MKEIKTNSAGIVSRWYWLYLLISLIVLIPGIFSLVVFGLKPSIDFTGGSTLEIQIQPAKEKTISTETLTKLSENNFSIHDVQKGNNNTITVKADAITNDQKDAFLQKVDENIGKVEEKQFETIGPSLGKELITKTVAALLLSAFVIALYLGIRFRSAVFGFFAMVAAAHDVLILLGSFSLLGHFMNVQVDTLFVTALLTILSFSVHDTIVVYDRIRERKKQWVNASFEEVIDTAVKETLTRSIRNSMAIIFMLLALFMLGGETTQWFALALLIGTIVGTYSSTFTALPLLIVWNKVSKKLKKRM